jgi:AraC-like DNA-binding protein
MHIDYQREGSLGILRTRNPLALGSNLQFVAEFWRSSMTSLLTEVLAHPFPSVAMYFPYRAPRYVDVYHQVFGCELYFGPDTMEWHFDAGVLEEDCPNADALTTQVCQEFCERIVSRRGQSKLQRSVRSLCMTKSSGAMATADSVAAAMGMSTRTFHRRLAAEGISFKTLLDETRFSIASEYLKNTPLSVEEIASRCGYGDVSNFRKAFRRWCGRSPTGYRESHQLN